MLELQKVKTINIYIMLWDPDTVIDVPSIYKVAWESYMTTWTGKHLNEEQAVVAFWLM